MAKIFPNTSDVEVTFPSQAEAQIYQLAQSLPDPWRVYYSVTLATKDVGEGIREGEIDFIFYHPSFGVVVLEVKGGRIRLDGSTGQFSSINRNGRSFVIKNPFLQAITWRNRFVRFLRSHNVHVPVSHGVCFPAVDKQEFPDHAIIEKSVLIGRSDLSDLEKTLESIVHTFHREDFLRFKDVSTELDQLLVGTSFESKVMLREYIDVHESHVTASDLMHDVLVSPLTAVNRLGIEGEAGTGKTVLAMNLAKYFSDQGKKVLYLVSSPLLAAQVSNSILSSIEVRSMQELASSFSVSLLVPPSDWQERPRDYVQLEAPERLRKAILNAQTKYDVLIVDEAQDIQPYWWIALEGLLITGEEARLYTFFDRDQGVFGGGDENQSAYRPEETLPVPPVYMRLHQNYRNTRQIAEFARGFRRKSQAVMAASSERNGYMPVVIKYKDAQDAKEKLKQLVDELTKERGVRNDELVILSGRSPESKESVLSGQTTIGSLKLAKLTSERLKSDEMVQSDELGIATIAAFKGLEASVVIAVNLSEYNLPPEHPIMSSLMYVAMTRAKHMLYVLVKEHDAKEAVMEKMSAAVQRGGALIVDVEESAGERMGQVLQFNPERASVIEIESSGLEPSERILMFGPDLRKAGIHSLKQGEKLLFKVRSDRGLTYAYEIKRSIPENLKIKA